MQRMKPCPEECGGLEMIEFHIEKMQGKYEVKRIDAIVPTECPNPQRLRQCGIKYEDLAQRYEIIPGDVVKIKKYKRGKKEPMAEKEMLLEGELEEFIEGLKGLQDELAMKLAPKQVYKFQKPKPIPKELAFQIRYLFNDQIEVDL